MICHYVFLNVIRSFLPSLPGECRHTDQILIIPESNHSPPPDCVVCTRRTRTAKALNAQIHKYYRRNTTHTTMHITPFQQHTRQLAQAWPSSHTRSTGSKAVTNVTDDDKSLQLIDDASRRCMVKVGDGSCGVGREGRAVSDGGGLWGPRGWSATMVLY
jgi:hypothetical protein